MSVRLQGPFPNASHKFFCSSAAVPTPEPYDVMRMIYIMNACGGKSGVAIPEGCYGNAYAFPVAAATAGDLAVKPLGTTVDLEMKRRRGFACLFPRPKPPRTLLRCVAAQSAPCWQWHVGQKPASKP